MAHSLQKFRYTVGWLHGTAAWQRRNGLGDGRQETGGVEGGGGTQRLPGDTHRDPPLPSDFTSQHQHYTQVHVSGLTAWASLLQCLSE